MRFLIDECLTVGLVDVANQAGYDARHIARVGKAAWKDWNIVAYAIEESLVFVTNNGSDFRKLYAAQSLHSGLIVIVPSVGQAIQERLFGFALEELAVTGEPVNRLIVVDLDDQEVTIDAYDWPSARRSVPAIHALLDRHKVSAAQADIPQLTIAERIQFPQLLGAEPVSGKRIDQTSEAGAKAGLGLGNACGAKTCMGHGGHGRSLLLRCNIWCSAA